MAASLLQVINDKTSQICQSVSKLDKGRPWNMQHKHEIWMKSDWHRKRFYSHTRVLCNLDACPMKRMSSINLFQTSWIIVLLERRFYLYRIDDFLLVISTDKIHFLTISCSYDADFSWDIFILMFTQ